ncbi:MAG: polyphosphate kinase 2 family protein [Pseudomonadota bacterium]|nr:polyphosphate kinase 2 family protein [Pseudomonadota bacterium]
MSLHARDFRVSPGERVDLARWPTSVEPFFKSKGEFAVILEQHVAALSAFQKVHYAAQRSALLLVFQGMDGSGKDGAIDHVMSGVNPAGCKVVSFKQPSTEELKHDFLWRSTCRLPERGQIGIFNRSYYEDVLVVRVHPELLAAQAIEPARARQKTFWRHRYRSITNMERHLCDNGTRVVKFFLHLSKSEQRKRFLERIGDPDKNWKMSASDIEERDSWREYMHAYEQCLQATATEMAPWYVVPADDKENARLIVSRIVLHTFESLNLSYPKIGAKQRRFLRAARKRLVKD